MKLKTRARARFRRWRSWKKMFGGTITFEQFADAQRFILEFYICNQPSK